MYVEGSSRFRIRHLLIVSFPYMIVRPMLLIATSLPSATIVDWVLPNSWFDYQITNRTTILETSAHLVLVTIEVWYKRTDSFD